MTPTLAIRCSSTPTPMIRAFALASHDVGYMVTEMNMHLFSAHEVAAFEDAVARHLEDSNPAE